MSSASSTSGHLERRATVPRGILVTVLLTVLSLAGCEGAAVSEQDARSTAVQPTAVQPTTVQPTTVQPTDVAQAESREDSSPVGLPLLLDLGASKCVPCKMMAPILDELSEEYTGVMQVVFIDVWEDRDAGMRHGIQSIPTQIFFDATGKELFRHEGFLSKEDILAKWEELGVELSPRSAEG